MSQSDDEKGLLDMAYIKYENSSHEEHMVNHKELKIYNDLYLYKKKLGGKNIIFYLTEEELVKLANCNIDPLHLRITKDDDLQKVENPKIKPKIKEKGLIVRPINKGTKTVMIKNIKYVINYKKDDEIFTLFTIKDAKGMITCSGARDGEINIKELINLNYNIITKKYNGFNFEIFMGNGFVTPVYVEIMEGKVWVTIDIFMDMLEHVMN